MYVYTIAVLSLSLVSSVIGSPVVGLHDAGKEYEQDIEKYKDAIAVSSECADHEAADSSKPRPSRVMKLLEDEQPLSSACSKFDNPVQAAVCLVLLNQLNTTCSSKTLYSTTTAMKHVFTALHFVTQPFEKETETKICDSAFIDPVLQSFHPSCELCVVGSPVRVACIILWQMNIALGTTTYSSAETKGTSVGYTGTMSGSSSRKQQTDADSSSGTTKNETGGTDNEQDHDTTGEEHVDDGNPDIKTINGGDAEEPGNGLTPPEENTDKKYDSDDSTNRVDGAVDHIPGNTDSDDKGKTPDGVGTATGGDAEEPGSKITSAKVPVKNTDAEVPNKTTDGNNNGNDDATKKEDQDITNGDVQIPEKDSKSENPNFNTSSLLTSPLCQSTQMLAFYKDGSSTTIQPVSPFNTACQSTTEPADLEVCKSAMDALHEFCFDSDKYGSVATSVNQWVTLDPTRNMQNEEAFCQAALQRIPGSKPDCEVCSTRSLMRPVCYMLYYLNYYMSVATASGNPEVTHNEGAGGGAIDEGARGGATDEGARGGATDEGGRGGATDEEFRGGTNNEGAGGGAVDEGARGGTSHEENELPGQEKNEYGGNDQEGDEYREGEQKETGGGTTQEENELLGQEKNEFIGDEHEGDQYREGNEDTFIPNNDYGSDRDNEASIVDKEKKFGKEGSDVDYLEEEGEESDSEIKITVDEKQKPMKKGQDTLSKNTYNMYDKQKFAEEESSSHFLAFSLTAIILILATYIAYHNKHKIIAVIIEGRSGRNGGRRGGSYRRLNQNVSS